MHLLVTQSRTLAEADEAVDLGQSAGDIVFLSFTDSDLGAVAAAAGVRDSRLTLRLASLAQLKHPYSIDLYVERVVAQARFVMVRLLGGLDYWRYGVDELARVARANGIALALLPGDHREDARLDEASTLPVADLRRLWQFFQHGGVDNIGAALGWIDSTLGHAAPWSEPKPLPPAGRYEAACRDLPSAEGRALITFYRSMVLAEDCAPIVALADALAAKNLAVTALYATSLKDPAAAQVLRAEIAALRPDVIVNTTAFSAKGDEGGSVLDAADAPVLQAILSGASEAQWRANPRGLGPADLAMNVVLPEMDGRLVTVAISTKAESPRHDALEFTRLVHRPLPSRIAFVAALAAAWVRLRRTPAPERRLAMVLSDYPGRAGRAAYAVGLDTWASVAAICDDLRAAGYAVADLPEDLAKKLSAPPSPASGRRGDGACSRRLSQAARRPARGARRRHHRRLGRPGR
jgi:cobaltochelatase CobN